MSSTPVSVLRALVREDEGRSAVLAELDRLLGATRSLRERTERIQELFRAAPSEQERLDREIDAAEREIHARSEALAQAQADLAEAERTRDEERLAAARRFVVRAGDALVMAEKRAAAYRSEARELEQRLAEAEREVPELKSEAASLAEELRDRPRLAREASREPPPGLAGVAEWASGARAALVVARSGAAVEREAVIREATELGSMILGEPLVASSVAVVARRVEEALGDSPAGPGAAT